ncbi:MAG: DUF7736 domain-containing protein [Planctomycetota bacterium]
MRKYGEMQSISSEAAIAMAKSFWWNGKTAREIVQFQLFVAELCMDFSDFHAAVEEVLDRPVWTHEFAAPERLQKEFLGEKEPPCMDDIIGLLADLRKNS